MSLLNHESGFEWWIDNWDSKLSNLLWKVKSRLFWNLTFKEIVDITMRPTNGSKPIFWLLLYSIIFFTPVFICKQLKLPYIYGVDVWMFLSTVIWYSVIRFSMFEKEIINHINEIRRNHIELEKLLKKYESWELKD